MKLIYYKNTITTVLMLISTGLSLHAMDEIVSKDAKEKPLEIKRLDTQQRPKKSPVQDNLEQEDGDALAQRSPAFTKNTALQDQIKAHVAWVLADKKNHDKSALKKYIETGDSESIQTLLFSYFDEVFPLINLLLQYKDYQHYKALIYVMNSAYKQTKNSDFSACATNVVRLGLNYAFKNNDKELFNAILKDYFVKVYPLIQNLIIRKKFDILAKAIAFGFDITQRSASNAIPTLQQDPQKRNYSLCRLALKTNNIEALAFLFKQQPQAINVMIADLFEEKGFFLDTVDIEHLYEAIHRVDPQSEILKKLLQLDEQLQKHLHTFLETFKNKLTQEELSLLKIETFKPDHKYAIVRIAQRLDKKTQRSDKINFLISKFYDLGTLLYETLTNKYVIFSQTGQLPESTAAVKMILPKTTTTSPEQQTHSTTGTVSPTPSTSLPSSPSSSTSSPLSFRVSPIISPILSPEFRPPLAMRGNREIPSIKGVFFTMEMLKFAQDNAC